MLILVPLGFSESWQMDKGENSGTADNDGEVPSGSGGNSASGAAGGAEGGEGKIRFL